MPMARSEEKELHPNARDEISQEVGSEILPEHMKVFNAEKSLLLFNGKTIFLIIQTGLEQSIGRGGGCSLRHTLIAK
jgi:hypothetical protein